MTSESQKIRVDRILEKLTRVRNRGITVFGSESHGFRLNQTVQESVLVDFESRHGIELPADYRAFLQYAGNGGAGPYYGIYPLEKWDDFATWVVDDPIPGFVALPCPLHPKIRREQGWEDEFDVESPYQGTISIGSQGCTYAMQLVVAGQYAGRVVYVDADGQPPYMVRNSDFLEWYERWLDELLAGCNMDWFGFGLGGTEEDLLRIIDDSTTAERDRAEAAEAICRLPELSDLARQRIKSMLSDSVEGVRAGACCAIRTFKMRHAEAATSLLLNDASADVRQQAVTTLMQLNAKRWNERVAERLQDEDSEVAGEAFLLLNDASKLGRARLLRIIAESCHENLRHYAAHAMDWKEEDESLLISLLQDNQSLVRFYATLGLRQIKSTASLPAVIKILDKENDELVVGSILKMLGELGGEDAKTALLTWTASNDDFHRLDAIDGLCKLGDERVAPIACEMLHENQPPKRVDAMGFTSQSHVDSTSKLVYQSLRDSPNQSLRKLVPGGRWLPWLAEKMFGIFSTFD